MKDSVSMFERVLSFTFFLFFVAQILSPYVGGVTVYLEVIVAILNPYFIMWALKRRIEPRWVYYIFVVAILSLLGGVVILLKIVSLTIAVMFLFYSFDRKIFYLQRLFVLSVVFAFAQFVLMFVDPGLSYLVGPTSISEYVWGQYATPTFTNFYTIFFFDRVSGLSREAGFLSSLVVAIFALKYSALYRNDLHSASRFSVSVLSLGYLLSFSKMSLVAVPVYFLTRVHGHIKRTPYLAVCFMFFLFMLVFWSHYGSFLLEDNNDTFLHRFGAYPTLVELDPVQLILGQPEIGRISSPYAAAVVDMNFDSFAGLGGMIIKYGMLFVIVLFLGLYLIGISGVGVLLLLLMTINVDMLTGQNFVALAYYTIFKYYGNRRIAM